MPSSRDTWGELRSACHAARQHPREAARALWLLCVEIGGTPDFWRLEWEVESDEGEAMLTYMRQTLPPECWDAITWVRGINGVRGDLRDISIRPFAGALPVRSAVVGARRYIDP